MEAATVSHLKGDSEALIAVSARLNGVSEQPLSQSSKTIPSEHLDQSFPFGDSSSSSSSSNKLPLVKHIDIVNVHMTVASAPSGPGHMHIMLGQEAL